jgi:hypothetical protein
MIMKWMQAETAVGSRARVVDADGRTGLVSVRWNSGHASFWGPVFTAVRTYDQDGAVLSEDNVVLDGSPEFVVRV